MVDVTELSSRVQDFWNELGQHNREVSNKFEALESAWQALSQEWDGRAANEFRSVWEGTRGGFQEYIDGSAKVSAALREKVEQLQDIDR